MAQRTNIPPVVCVGPQYCGTTLDATTLNNDIKNADAALSTSHLKALCLPSTAGGVMQPFLGYGYAWQVPQQGYNTSGGFHARQNEYRPFAHFSGVCPSPNVNDPTLWVYDMYRDIPVIAHSWEDSFALTIEGMRGQRFWGNQIAAGSSNSLDIWELVRNSATTPAYAYYYRQYFRVEYYMGGILSPLVLLDQANNDTDFPINTLRSNYNLNAYDFRGAMPAGYSQPIPGQDRTDFVRVIVRFQRGANPFIVLPYAAENINFVFAQGNAGAFGETDFDGISSLSFSMYKSPC